jgi:hypothetical protein
MSVVFISESSFLSDACARIAGAFEFGDGGSFLALPDLNSADLYLVPTADLTRKK